MTFNETISWMNEQRPSALYHIWQDYADGTRGYSTSCDSLRNARGVASRLPGGTIYDRDGNDVEAAQ